MVLTIKSFHGFKERMDMSMDPLRVTKQIEAHLD